MEPKKNETLKIRIREYEIDPGNEDLLEIIRTIQGVNDGGNTFNVYKCITDDFGHNKNSTKIQQQISGSMVVEVIISYI